MVIMPGPAKYNLLINKQYQMYSSKCEEMKEMKK